MGSGSAAQPGRNDPCPCGSGRKFKHCCAGKRVFAAPAAAQPAPADDLARVQALREGGRFLEAGRLAERYLGRHPNDPAAHSALGLVRLHGGRAGEALPNLVRAARLAPDNAQYHNDAGFALEALGRDLEAITAYRSTLALDPRHGEALEHLGGLLLAHGQRKEAIDCFHRVAEHEPDTILGRINRAKILAEDRRTAELEELLRQTILRFPANAEAKRFLAEVLREDGRFAEAIPLLEAATEGGPTSAATAYFDLAMSKKITAADAPMIEQMTTLLDYRALSDIARQRLRYGLGKANDDLGDYALAMRHFDEANRLAARARPFDRSYFGACIYRLITGTSPDLFAENRALGSSSELPVLILGMPRSGTTLVEQIVSAHPEVGAGDELPFWNEAAEDFARRGAAAMTPDHAERVAAEYEALLRKIAPAARRVTDKMPGNYLWISLIHTIFPKARIIHCRRHPVDTCLSNYFTNFSSPMPYTNDKGHLAFYYRWYERLMAHWQAILPPGTMFEVDYERLVEDRDTVTRQLIDFLGLDWDDACLAHERNERSIRTASMWQARQPIYRSSTERWRRYEPWLGELAALLDDNPPADPAEPVSDSARIPEARRLREAGRLDEAVAALQKGLRETPYDPLVYNELGGLCLETDRVEPALDGFERAIGLNPNFAVAHYNRGAALERLGRPADAAAALRRAIALKPDLGGAYSRLGNLLQAEGNEAEAQECFRRAAELATNPADRDLEEAKLLLGDGRAAEAEPRLRNVVALDPGNSLAHAMLGDLLGQAGRFDEAAALLRRATEIDPDRIGAWHNLAILRKISAADRPLVDRLTAMLEEPRRTDFERTLLNFALGKAHDDLGEYERAIGHFDQGNALEKKKLDFDRADLAAGVDRLIATFTPEFLARNREVGTASDLPVLILGMPRSGTTLVEQIVSAHPKVAGGGELPFWGDHQQTSGGAAAIRQFAADYLDLLRRIGPQAVRVTDKTPFNFFVLGMIQLGLPRARVIHCRRDPIDTCLSIYFTRFAKPQVFAYDRGDLVFYYRQYQRLMAHWRAVLPPATMLEVDYEVLTADPETQSRRIVDFCGLDWDDSCSAPERNRRVVQTASVWQARQPIYRSSVARWQRYAPWLGELRDLHEPVCGED